MASSPTSSCHSSYSSPFTLSSTTPIFADLPVTALRTRIVDKILENRVTLIIGETGCGKSSQIPQFLLEENMEPILCTQPRRFAVVAVARMVAKARNCEVGGEVGYHIGHSRVYSERSKIIFKTAGVLLDEMCEKGLNALKYKVIILDEVHERSVESDLVLVCVKQFLLKNKDLRVVLMSATADIARYREYFKDLGKDERVEVLAIPSSCRQIIFQRRVSYLEQVAELLGMSSELLSLRYCSGESPSTADAEIKPEVQRLIHELVLHIHRSEPDIEKSILIFLPTYYSLEQQWFLLKAFSSSFKVLILHSSVDTDQALKAMKIWKSQRKVILATNIAESSVTIPQVAYVIDSCRSLQVFWDIGRKTDSAELVWVSKSQAEQRGGRTGRTCDGQIYRMVTESFFGHLQKYEPPAILRLSLRQQVLLICCAASKVINDPKVLLQKALDPPDPAVIEDTLSLLVHMHALERTYPRGRYEPTFYGRLLSSFSLSFDASVLLVKFGEVGMLREGIIVGILMDAQPLPIIRPFGQDTLFAEHIESYYSGDSKTTGLTGKKEVISMGNFYAFLFWQHIFNDNHRLQQLKQSLLDNAEDTLVPLSKIEEDWCSVHNLLPSSLHHVDETYEDVLNSFHRLRPKFFATSDSLPSYYDPYDFQHTCFLEEKFADFDVDAGDEEHSELASKVRKCVTVPFVASNYFQIDKIAEKMAAIVKEMRIHLTEDASGKELDSVNVSGQVSGGASLCRFFFNGSCTRGRQCLFSHSFEGKKPVCRFFFSLQGCRNGDSCFFSHDLGPSIPSYDRPICLPEDEDANATSLLLLLPRSHEGSILILDDTDFHFSSHISRHYNPSSIICTSSFANSSVHYPSLDGIRILWGLSHPYQTIISESGKTLIPWNEVRCVLWFPKFDDCEHLLAQKSLIKTFFNYLAIRIFADTLHKVRVILTVNNARFSQLQVEKLGRDSFFFLGKSFPYDESSFGRLFDSTYSRNQILSKPISYVFNLCPPSDVQFGDYKTLFHQHLHNITDKVSRLNLY